MLRPAVLFAVAAIADGLSMAHAEPPLGTISGTLSGVQRSWHTRLDGPDARPGTTAVERFDLLHAVSLEGYPSDDGGGDGLGVLSLRLSVAPSGQRVLAARVLFYPESYGAFYVSPPVPGTVNSALGRYIAPGEIAGRLTTTLCWQAGPLSHRDASRCREGAVRFETDLPLAE